MKKITSYLILPILCVIANFGNAIQAQTIDWGSVNFSGNYPAYTFTDSTLGNVSLLYSGNEEYYGVSQTNFAEPALIMGNTANESFTLSWSNSVTSLNAKFFDFDGSESVSFGTTANISAVDLNATDRLNTITKVLSADGINKYEVNGDPSNYSIINFSNAAGFNSITMDWNISGSPSTGVFGLGIIQVPEPSSLLYGLVGCAFLFQRRRK